MYHFQLDINDTIRQDSEYHFLASRKHGEWSQIGEKLVTKLMQEEMQGMVSYSYVLYTIHCSCNSHTTRNISLMKGLTWRGILDSPECFSSKTLMHACSVLGIMYLIEYQCLYLV
jgi:hypothetical protein